mmetsp:Transcript_82224/g.233113  ORF Transcript_82224/g.233113 Transcript_82224/m.233113 type:complete len:313 (-) Transcript_82224:3-941(-)
MEEVVLALPEDLPQEHEVHRAEVRLGPDDLVHELVDLGRREVGLAPQVQLRGDLHLLAARLDRALERAHHRVGAVGRTGHPGRHPALCEVLVILPQRLAQPPELLGPLVRAAELEGVAGRLVVHLLQARVRLQHVQDRLVGVPQEPEVHVDVAVLAVLPRVVRLDGAQEDCLRGLTLVQVLHLRHLRVLQRVRVVHLVFGGLPELLHDLLHGADVRGLADGPVLVQAVAGVAVLPQLHAELQVLHDDPLRRVRPLVAQLLVVDRGVEGVQGVIGLADLDELLGLEERVLRRLGSRHPCERAQHRGGSAGLVA